MAKLAIAGGEKAVTRPLGKKWPIWDEREQKALQEVLESGLWWRGGHREGADESKVGQFEDAFSAYHNAKYGLAVTNGTAALECALRAVGVEPGDEVLVPALTFVASATAIAMVGAIPVFVDVEANAYNIDPDAMEAAITGRTKAAVVVHNGGYPADMDRVVEIAKRRRIRIVEDCAHAHGSQWNGRGVGAIGDMGGFSFQMGKVLTCGEGGMILTDDDALVERAFSLHHVGRIPGRPSYKFSMMATNLRMTEWQGAILLSQFSRFDEQVETRERNTARLAEGLREIDGIDPIDRDARVTRWGFYYWNFHYTGEAFDGIPKAAFMKAMNAEGVSVSEGAHGGPIYKNPMFQSGDWVKDLRTGKPVDYSQTYCPVAEEMQAARSLKLGHAAFLGGLEDMDLILEATRKVRANIDELRSIV